MQFKPAAWVRQDTQPLKIQEGGRQLLKNVTLGTLKEQEVPGEVVPCKAETGRALRIQEGP